ncbi:hypothetical protein [Streptomyces sp. NPDC001422]|uniref:hypothetical protein n=1 Tax=Streptomyces sp. NPDC001422 TaxID=3364575 RepID=UPI00367CB294
MSAELVIHPGQTASLPDMVRYAEHLANANLLPGQYRKQPANVLYAMEYGRTLGITPLAAITGIHVIEGKPSASAALISGLVRQAGHKLRVRVEGGQGGARAIATIHRSDDPDFEFRAEWDMQRARDAGLANKDVWKKYPQAMLKARAITEVARDACEEVLFGLHYTPEELNANVSEDGIPLDAEVQQLRRVQSSEGDPWATAGPSQGDDGITPEQGFADVAGTTTDQAAVKELYRQANAAGLLAATVKVGEESLELGTYLIARGQKLAGFTKTGDATGDDGVTDIEVVAEGESEADIAERDLRAAAAKAGLDNLDEEFERSYGLPITEAGAPQMREMTALLTGTAA